MCPPGHIIEDGKCVECGSCVLNLLKRVENMNSNLTMIKENLIPPELLVNVSLGAVNKTFVRYSVPIVFFCFFYFLLAFCKTLHFMYFKRIRVI